MQFKVPQNIDLEDKIVGPLTLNQFITLVIGGVIVYVTLTQFGLASIGFIFIGVPVGLFTLAWTFLKINDQPFGAFFLSLIRFITHPKTFVWGKNANAPHGVIVKPAPKKKIAPRPTRHITKSELEKLAFSLDTRGSAVKPSTEQPKPASPNQGEPINEER